MRLERARPLVQEVALSGFGDDDEFGRRGRRGGRRRRGPAGRGRHRHHPEEEDDEDEVAGRKERKARRRLRRRQRGQRQSLKAKQKLNRSRGGRRGKRQRGGDGGSRTSPAPRRPSHSPSRDYELEDAQPTRRRPLLRRRAMQSRGPEEPLYEDDDFIDAEWEEEPFEDWEAEFEEETLAGAKVELGRAVRRGLLEPGAARRVWDRIRTNVKDRVQKRRDERGNRRGQRNSQASTATSPPASTPGWNPPGAMGNNLRVQARAGHRAAVMELRSGLYLVADVTSEVLMPSTQGEDVGAVLPGLMAKAAITAIRNRRERRQNALTALQPRELPGPTSPPLQMHGVDGLPWSG